MSLKDIHTDEQNDAHIEAMLGDVKDMLKEGTEQAAHLSLCKLLIASFREDMEEKSLPDAVARVANFGALVMVKLAKSQNEQEGK